MNDHFRFETLHFFLPDLNVRRLSTFSKYTFPLKTLLLSTSCHEHSLMLAVYTVCQIYLWAIHVTLHVCLCSHPLQSMSDPMVGWLLQMISLTLEFSSALSEGMCVCEWMHDIRNKWMSREIKWIISRYRSLVWYMDFVSRVCPGLNSSSEISSSAESCIVSIYHWRESCSSHVWLFVIPWTRVQGIL